MVSSEHLRDIQPEPATYTVPTEKMRAATSASSRALIYDPATATRARHGHADAVCEQSHSGRPHQPGGGGLRGAVSASRTGRARRSTTSRTCSGRTTTTPSWRASTTTSTREPHLFVTGYCNKRQEDRYNWAQDATNATGRRLINGFPITKGFDYRSNTGRDRRLHVRRCRSRPVLDVRVSGHEFGENRDPAADFDPASLGFSSTARRTDGRLPDTCRSSRSAASARPTRTRRSRRSARSARTGARASTGRWTPIGGADADEDLGRPHGSRRLRLPLPAVEHHQLGLPGRPVPVQRRVHAREQLGVARTTARNRGRSSCSACRRRRPARWRRPARTSSQFEIASPGDFRQTQHGLFVQDDWRVNARLTLNLGVRLEINGGMSEAQNRNLAGFDTVSVNPIEAAAQAAYATNPIAADSGQRTSRSTAACCLRTVRSTRRRRRSCRAAPLRIC